MEQLNNPNGTEGREEQAEKLINFLHRIKTEQVFDNEEHKREFIENLTFDEFKDWIERLNGILRDIPIAERSLDGNGVAMVPNPDSYTDIERIVAPRRTEYLPRQEDKEGLLKEMFDSVQQMSREGASMEDIAILVSASINAIHLFVDGNGRTSRLLNYLLNTDYSESPEQVEYLRKILGKQGRLFININPGEAQQAIDDYIFTHDLGIKVDDLNMPKSLSRFSPKHNTKEKIKEKVPPEIIKDFQEHIIGDEAGDHGFFAVYKYLKKKGKLEEFLTPIIREDKLIRTDLRIVDLVERLNPEEYKEILDIFWELKKEGVSLLINSIVKPENYIVEDIRYGNYEKGNIKDIFLKNIDKAYLKSSLEVNFKNISEIWEERDTLPFSSDTYSSEEMEKINQIRFKLREIIEQEKLEKTSLNFDFQKAEDDLKAKYAEISEADKRAYESTESEEIREYTESDNARHLKYKAKKEVYKPVLDISNKYLDETITLLDSLDIWKHKFTTRDESRRASDEEREDTDSIYYVTKSGQSLRLRRYALLDQKSVHAGISKVIEPIMEKIFFVDEQENCNDEPKEGNKIIEYVTDEFLEAQDNNSGQEFKSHIRRYTKDGKVIYLNPIDGHMHRGYEIHRLFK